MRRLALLAALLPALAVAQATMVAPDRVVSGNLTAACATPTAACAAGQAVSLRLSGLGGIGITFTAGFTGTVVPDLSYDGGTTWTSTSFDNPSSATIASSLVNPATGAMYTLTGAGGASHARVRVSSYTSGTGTVAIRATFQADPTVSIAGVPPFPGGYLRITDEPHQLFVDPFDNGASLDTTNRWNAAVAGGGGVACSTSGGNLTCGTGTTLNGYSYLTSQPTFTSTTPGWLRFANNIALPYPVVASTYMAWGGGRVQTTPSSTGCPACSNTFTDAAVFEVDTDGKMYASVYQGGVRTAVCNLSSTGTNAQPTDNLTHNYAIFYRPTKIYWFLDSTDVPACTSTLAQSALNVDTLQSVYLAVQGSTSAATLTSNAVSVSDTAKNNVQISDGTYPHRKAKIEPSGAQVVRSHPVDVGAYGSYAACGITGTMAAGTYTNAPIFAFRWPGSTVAIVRTVTTSLMSLGTGFAAGSGTMKMVAARSFTAQDTGGGAVTLTTNNAKRRTSHATTASLLQIATTAALSAGTRTLDATPLAITQFGVTTAVNTVHQPTTNLWMPNFDGEWPLVLAANEGFEVQATVPLTGTWQAIVCVEWSELPSF